ncbi:hypothetical protein DPMN_089392 [Dreissena polymorpha]|uniref:Uncharacterized protein n=1 Tax=Dreissena polymorpha TaxID=45954 RepID=A0A9D4QY16_DREPO|nr:hypothetical protein DPMN_089392 [Dreissena polymorpha]
MAINKVNDVVVNKVVVNEVKVNEIETHVVFEEVDRSALGFGMSTFGVQMQIQTIFTYDNNVLII